MTTDQQLYMDGQLMDISESTNITLDMKSNLFRDVSKLTANYTYTIQLPKTTHNMAVLELAAKPTAGTSYPYVFHTARYLRNGIEIINNGRATVLSVKETIEVSIYFGMFPAFVELKSSGLKLNELGIEGSLTFNSRSKPDKYSNAMLKGIFYADYNTAQVRSVSDDWTSYDITQGESKAEMYELVSGKIKTGGTVGEHISGTVIADDDYLCTSAPFAIGQTAAIDQIVSKGDYRMWAVVDANGNILTMSEDVKDQTPTNVSVQAPTMAARIIINAIKAYSKGTRLTIAASTGAAVAKSPSYSGTGMRYQVGAIQPSVSCKHLLSVIATKTGVQTVWSSKAMNVIGSLAIPLINRKADENTLSGSLSGSFGDTTQLGDLTMTIAKDAPDVIWDTSTSLTVKQDCTMTIDVQMMWLWDASNTKPQGYRSWTNDDGTVSVIGVYSYPPYYIEMKVKSPQQDSEETYIIGSSNDGGKTATSNIEDTTDTMINGKFVHLIAGRGTLDFVSGDIITFTLKNKSGKILKGFSCYNGTLNMTIAQSEEVPYGGSFPIGKNLPDITVMEFIKALCVITGCFPLQRFTSNVLQLRSIADVIKNKSNVVDWTKKLIANDGYNQPRELDYSISDYCQHNLYKWKEDETVYDDHDADLTLDNATMDATRDVYTLPFAASDGNRVPIYEWEDYEYEVSSSSSGSKTAKGVRATKYKACKDRIMNVYEDSEGNAALRFDIDLQSLFDNDLKEFRAMIAHPRQVTERIMLTDLDLLNFDETRPVYLAQYACYFLVLEIKTTNKGYCEVNMIKIN